MITLLGIGVIAAWFYTAAKNVHKSGILWLFIGLTLYFVLGFTFLFISENFILQSSPVTDAFSVNWEKIFLELISAILILFSGYLIHNKFLVNQN